MRKIFLLIFICLFLIDCRTQSDKNVKAENRKIGIEQLNQGWSTISGAEFEKLLVDTTVQLVDVRTPDEYKSGHIPGARNIDVRDEAFDKAIEQLDKKKPVAVYCRSGVRSKAATAKMVQKGFRVYELKKGINSWTGKQEK